MMVSPYLRRPLRRLEEVTGERDPEDDLEATIRHVVAEARRAGQGRHDRLNRAAMMVMRARPDLSPLDALALVNQALKEE